jgi:hypothetical protein
MAQTSGTVKLEELVNGFLWQSNRPREDYRRLFKIATDGVRDLNILHTKEGRTTAKLTMDVNLTVPFPDDMIGFVSAGVPVKGRYWAYTRDDSILDVADRDTSGDDATAGDYGYLWTYGAQGGVNKEGYYKVNYKTRTILFDHIDRTDVILVYTSSGVNTDEDTYIPVMYEPLLYAYIAYMESLYRNDVPMNAKVMFKENYDIQVNIFNTLQASTLDEWYDTVYGLMSQSPLR